MWKITAISTMRSQQNWREYVHSADEFEFRRTALLPIPIPGTRILLNPGIYTPILLIGTSELTMDWFHNEIITLSIEGRTSDLQGDILDPIPGAQFHNFFETIIFAGCCPVTRAVGLPNCDDRYLYADMNPAELANRLLYLVKINGSVLIRDCITTRLPIVNAAQRKIFIDIFYSRGFVNTTPRAGVNFLPFQLQYKSAPPFLISGLENKWTAETGALYFKRFK